MIISPDLAERIDRLGRVSQDQDLSIGSIYADLQAIIQAASTEPELTAYLLEKFSTQEQKNEPLLVAGLQVLAPKTEIGTQLPVEAPTESIMLAELSQQLNVLTVMGLGGLTSLQSLIEARIKAENIALGEQMTQEKVGLLQAAVRARLEKLPAVRPDVVGTQASTFVRNEIKRAIELAYPNETDQPYVSVEESPKKEGKLIFKVTLSVLVKGAPQKFVHDELALDETFQNMHVLEPQYLLTFVLGLLDKISAPQSLVE